MKRILRCSIMLVVFCLLGYCHSVSFADAERKVYDSILFGCYEQDSNTLNGKEPIEWLIIDTDEDKQLLISKYAIESQPFGNEKGQETWESSQLRRWMNSEFFETAFSDSEQTAIEMVEVTNIDQGNVKWEDRGGRATQDRLFCLSCKEAEYYFPQTNQREAKATKYASDNGAWALFSSNTDWWTRSAGEKSGQACVIYADGGFLSVDYKNKSGVRPVMWIDSRKISNDVPSVVFAAAVDLMEKGAYIAAAEKFDSIGDYSNSNDKGTECKYLAACELLSAGDCEMAIRLFESIPEYKDSADKKQECLFSLALQKKEQGESEEAVLLLRQIPEHEGTKEQIKECYRIIADQFVQAGCFDDAYRMYALADNYVTKHDTVTIGCFEQDNNFDNGPEPIEWVVIEVIENKALLMSKKGLAWAAYSTRFEDVTWENSSLRMWLNGEFVANVFSEEEKTAIVKKQVDCSENSGNKKWNSNAGNSTMDEVFLLSYSEEEKLVAEFLFSTCEPTKSAESQGASIGWFTTGASWWLRSPGTNAKSAAYVSSHGGKGDNSEKVTQPFLVRPVIWINLEKSLGNNDELRYAHGVAAQESGDYINAIQLFMGIRTMMDVEKRLGACLIERGKELCDQGCYEEAYTCFEEAMGEEEKDKLMQRTAKMMADDLMISCKYDAALEWYQKAGAELQDAENNLLLLAAHFMENMNYEKAFTSLALIANPEISAPEMYALGKQMEKENDIELAKECYGAAGNYKDAANRYTAVSNAWTYSRAEEAYKNGEYDTAAQLFGSITGYRDAKKKAQEALAEYERQVKTDRYKRSIGKTVKYGSYEQDNNKTNGKEPIDWIILEVKDDKCLLISKHSLDAVEYHKTVGIHSTWENSFVRKWLNSTFYQNAFSSKEQKGIVLSIIDNSSSQGRPGWDQYTCAETKDRLFCLSHKEVGTYFKDRKSARTDPTKYVLEKTSYGPGLTTRLSKGNGFCVWWLRSPSNEESEATCVSTVDGDTVRTYHFSEECVRPAMWVLIDFLP